MHIELEADASNKRLTLWLKTTLILAMAHGPWMINMIMYLYATFCDFKSQTVNNHQARLNLLGDMGLHPGEHPHSMFFFPSCDS